MDDYPAVVRVAKEGNDIAITCSGALDLHNYHDLRAALRENATSADSIAVDFREVIYIDTAVIAEIAVAANKLMARDKRLRVSVTDPSHPLRTLQITGFSTIVDLDITPKEEAAS